MIKYWIELIDLDGFIIRWINGLSLWPSGIGSRLGRNRLWVRFLAVSDIYPMFIEPTITWVPSGFSGYIWLDTKIVLKKKNGKPLFRQFLVFAIGETEFEPRAGGWQIISIVSWTEIDETSLLTCVDRSIKFLARSVYNPFRLDSSNSWKVGSSFARNKFTRFPMIADW